MNYEKFEVCPVTNEKCIPTCGFHFENLGTSTHMKNACTFVICLLNEHPVADRVQYDKLLKAYDEAKNFDKKYGHIVKALNLDKTTC